MHIVVNAIHNGELERPVILIATGLGTTEEAFGTLGVSRFAKHCIVELGPLGKEAECAVLHDWLTRDGKATRDTTVWIDAITQETYGWPQHILSYVEPALDQLHANNGVMTAEGLNTVLEEGRTGRVAYYKQRAKDLAYDSAIASRNCRECSAWGKGGARRYHDVSNTRSRCRKGTGYLAQRGPAQA